MEITWKLYNRKLAVSIKEFINTLKSLPALWKLWNLLNCLKNTLEVPKNFRTFYKINRKFHSLEIGFYLLQNFEVRFNCKCFKKLLLIVINLSSMLSVYTVTNIIFVWFN